MKLAYAFLTRDLRVAWSYRFSFLAQNIAVIFSLLSLKFVAKLFDGSTSASLKVYGGEYFSFALLGMCVTLLSYPTVRAFAQSVRAAQLSGTFEAMLTTRARPALIIVSGGIYPILAVCVQVLLVFTIGWLALGAHLKATDLALVTLVFAMLLTSLIGVGLMSAAFVVAFRQTEPLSGAILSASVMVSGALYPTSVLPTWLAHFAPLLPMTHAIELARGLLLQRASVASLTTHAGALAAFCLTVPAGLMLLSAAITWAKRTGSLSHY